MRWSGLFPTPNVAAVALAAAAVIVLLCATWVLKPERRRWSLLAGSALILTAGLLAGLLIATGSRAGLLAAVAALALLAHVRQLSRLTSLLGVGVLLVGTVLAPHAGRFLPDALVNASFTDRLRLWKAGLTLIRDHPWRGVGVDQVPILLDRWYLPEELAGRFATALNEPLTIAAAWGIPALVLILAVFGSALGVGWTLARRGDRWAACACVLFVTHVLGGQFQAHVFAWWQIQVGYAVAIAALMIAVFHHRSLPPNWRIGAAMGSGAASAFAVVALCAGWSPWITQQQGTALVARPRPHDETATTFVLFLGTHEPHIQVRRWCDAHRHPDTAIVVLHKIPAGVWWNDLPGTRIRAYAHGQAAADLWQAWVDGQTGIAELFLSDPTSAPSGSARGLTAPVILSIARGNGFSDRVAIAERLQQDGQEPPMVVPGPSAAWWNPTSEH